MFKLTQSKYIPLSKVEVKSYIDDKLHGKKVSYYQDGTMAFEGSFNFGKRNGHWIYYSNKGKIVKNILYKNGKLESS